MRISPHSLYAVTVVLGLFIVGCKNDGSSDSSEPQDNDGVSFSLRPPHKEPVEPEKKPVKPVNPVKPDIIPQPAPQPYHSHHTDDDDDGIYPDPPYVPPYIPDRPFYDPIVQPVTPGRRWDTFGFPEKVLDKKGIKSITQRKTYSAVELTGASRPYPVSPPKDSHAGGYGYEAPALSVIGVNSDVNSKTIVHDTAGQLAKLSSSSMSSWETLGGPLLALYAEGKDANVITATVLMIGELDNLATRTGYQKFMLEDATRASICTAVYSDEFSNYVKADVGKRLDFRQKRNGPEYADRDNENKYYDLYGYTRTKAGKMERNPLANLSKVCDLNFSQVNKMNAYNLKAKTLLDRIGRHIADNVYGNADDYRELEFPLDNRDVIDELNKVVSVPVNDWHRGITIVYSSGKSEGAGLTGDWFSKVFEKLTDPANGFFTPVNGQYFLLPPKSANTDMWQLEDLLRPRYKAIGYLLALSLIEGFPLGIEFNEMFYQFIVNETVSLESLVANIPDPKNDGTISDTSSSTVTPQVERMALVIKPYDSVLYNKWLGAKDCAKDDTCDELKGYGLYLTSLDGKRSFSVSNGFEDEITADNASAWATMAVNDYVNTVYGLAMDSIVKGFYTLLPRNLFYDYNGKAFITAGDLREMLRGDPNVPFELLKESMEFPDHGIYSAGTEERTHFESILKNGDNNFRLDFYYWVTGLRAVPMGGLGEDSKTIIKINGSTHDGPPQASTCHKVISLPKFKSEEELKEKLLYAVTSTDVGAIE